MPYRLWVLDMYESYPGCYPGWRYLAPEEASASALPRLSWSLGWVSRRVLKMPSSLVLKMARLNIDSGPRALALLCLTFITAGRSSGSPSCSVCESHLGKLAARDARCSFKQGRSFKAGQSSGSPSCKLCGSHQGKPASCDARSGAIETGGGSPGTSMVKRRGGGLAASNTASILSIDGGAGAMEDSSNRRNSLHAVPPIPELKALEYLLGNSAPPFYSRPLEVPPSTVGTKLAL